MGMVHKQGQVFWIKYYHNSKPYYESSKRHKETKARLVLKKREEGNLPFFRH